MTDVPDSAGDSRIGDCSLAWSYFLSSFVDFGGEKRRGARFLIVSTHARRTASVGRHNLSLLPRNKKAQSRQ